MQPAEHGEECGERLRNAHGDVQVSAICDPVRTGLVRHIWPRLHQRPPLVCSWGDVVTDHKPHRIYWLLDIGPHDNAEGEVGEEQPENDAGEALDRKGWIERATRTEKLKVVELLCQSKHRIINNSYTV